MPQLIINPIGGLANRMRFMASGLALAKAIGCDYRIVWFPNHEIMARLEDIFIIPEEILQKVEYVGILKYVLLYLLPKKKNLYISQILSNWKFGLVLRDSMPPLKELIVSETSANSIRELVEKAITNGKDCLIQGGVSIYPYSSYDYRCIFRPNRLIQERIKTVVEKLGQESIGIHIRRSDNRMSIEHSPDTLFMDEMDAATAKNANTKFYLATDDEITKTVFGQKYGSKVIYNTSKANRNTKQGIIDAATEMFILSYTKRIVGSYYSSFSEAAAMLGNRPFKQVFCK